MSLTFPDNHHVARIFKMPHQPTIAEIDELIEDLERVMNAFSPHNQIPSLIDTAVNSNSITENVQSPRAILMKEIWAGFLEYCKSNELDPAQQVKEAISSNYRDALKSYRFRVEQTLNKTLD